MYQSSPTEEFIQPPSEQPEDNAIQEEWEQELDQQQQQEQEQQPAQTFLRQHHAPRRTQNRQLMTLLHELQVRITAIGHKRF